jgi:hypothetical protein
VIDRFFSRNCKCPLVTMHIIIVIIIVIIISCSPFGGTDLFVHFMFDLLSLSLTVVSHFLDHDVTELSSS